MGFGIDWDGDGKVSQKDDMITLAALDSDAEQDARRGGGGGCCLISTIMIIGIPVLIIGAFMALIS